MQHKKLKLCDKEKVPRNNRLEQIDFNHWRSLIGFSEEKSKKTSFFIQRYKEATELDSNYRN